MDTCLKYRRKVGSLLNLSIEAVSTNLSLCDLNSIKYLPDRIKHNFICKLTTQPFRWKNLDFNVILEAVIYPRLNAIDLTSAIVDDLTLEILEKCINLKEIYIKRSGNGTMTKQALIKLLTQTRSLVVIDIANCCVVDDDTMDTLANYCPNLTTIYADGCQITDLGIISLAEKNHNLGYLVISNTQIGNKGIRALLETNAESLLELRMDNCQNVSDDSLIDIAMKCPNIKILTFNDTSTSVDALVKFQDLTISKHLKQLHWSIFW